jgi:hypothetical protein
MQPLTIVAFSWSSDALVMCFVTSLRSFVIHSVLIRRFGRWS